LVLKEEFLTTQTSGHPGRLNSAAEEELFQKNCLRSTVSEALFKKILFRRLGSEGGISDHSDVRTSRTSQFCSRRRTVSEALFEKNCFRSTVSEDIVQKTWF